MRHPTTGLSEDDLSRLTGSSSSTASCDSNSSSPSSSSSSSSSSSAANTPAHKEGVDSVECVHHTLTSPDKTTNNTLALVASTLKQNNNNIINISSINNHLNNNNNNNNNGTHTNTSTRFSSTYLPELINPLEWQKSRKRKERLDSTSSVTQDRKLQRSNSEELLTQEQQAATVGSADALNAGGNALKENKSADVIRRVSSEDFKKTASYAIYEQELREAAECRAADLKQRQTQQQKRNAADENDGALANRQKLQQTQQQQQEDTAHAPVYRDSWVTGPTKDMTRRSRYETSPARSQRFSPIRSNGANGNSNKHRDSDDSECEHERRRSSERSCKSRQPPGRKVGVVKKSSASGGSNSASSSAAKYLATSKRLDENSAYKYDLSTLKYERRGFISKKGTNANSSSNSSNGSGNEKTTNDHNDNNLIDFHQQPQKQSASTAQTPAATGAAPSTQLQLKSVNGIATAAPKENKPAPTPQSVKRTSAICSAYNSVPLTAAQEALPWGRSVPEDATPMLSRRYAPVRHHPVDNLDTAAKLSKVMPYPQQFHKQSAAQRFDDDMDCMDSLSTFRAFTSRDVMEQVIPAMMSFQSPEERLKQVNKRLTALKKKLVQLEEAYEMRMGYRPSQAERMNDKYMKNILAEINKLRKERQELKVDPMGALGMKVSGGMDAAKKLEKMKTTLQEIEQNLSDKREDTNRSESLDELNADQLVQEKSAVQHGLLYFESLYGRPGTKDERDAARPLYDRYRQLKRMVLRSVMQSGSAVAGAPELPTILENEAMVFEFTPHQLSSANSTESNSPSDSATAPNASSDDSTTTTTGATTGEAAAATTTAATTQTAANSASENISALNLEQLWEYLEKTREEKKILKRTIREYETIFEEQNGRKMLKNDRKTIEETYAQYKEKKAKTRLLQELIKKQKRSFA